MRDDEKTSTDRLVEYRMLADNTGGAYRVGAFVRGRCVMQYKGYFKHPCYDVMHLYPDGMPNEAPRFVNTGKHDVSIYNIRAYKREART